MFYEEEYQNGIVAWNLNSHSVFELFSDQISGHNGGHKKTQFRLRCSPTPCHIFKLIKSSYKTNKR